MYLQEAPTLFHFSVACYLAATRPRRQSPSPQVLIDDHYELVGTLTGIILPTTDTPGARDAGVPVYIDEMLTTWYP